MIEKYELKAVFEETANYCDLSKSGDFIEVVEWKNGEGVDVNLSRHGGEQKFSFTWGEYKLFIKLVRALK